MKKTLSMTAILLLCLTSYGVAQELRPVKGKITYRQTALENVQIIVQGQDRNTFTDKNGMYEIQVATGEVLEYRYAGMKTYTVPVEEVTRFLNLVMVPDIQELEEVTVTSSKRKSRQQLEMEYATNPRLIRTYFGLLDMDTAPGKITAFMDDDIKPIGLCILDVIRNRFAGIRTTGNCFQGGNVIIRGVGSVTQENVAVYDVDGQIFTETPIWLDINHIKRVAIISSLSYGSRYGAITGGGIVIINTVNGFAPNPKLKDLARLRNNYVKGPALGVDDLKTGQPEYLLALQNSSDLDEAKLAFSQYKERYSASPYFFLDTYRYFYGLEEGRDFADAILRTRNDLFIENAVLLKALAYTYQEQGRYKEALELFKEIFILRPHYSQSYMDLAVAYREAGKPGKAAGMYARYQYLIDEDFLKKSEEFAKIIQHESDNLLQLEAKNIGTDGRRISTDLFVQESTRLVFEWNDSAAEFELQFVNPEGQFYTWKHTFADNAERIQDENENRYSVSEYVLDRSLPGTWKINVNYLGNKSLSPTYLKATTYYNYGTKLQRSAIQVFKLLVKDVNRELFAVSNGSVTQ